MSRRLDFEAIVTSDSAGRPLVKLPLNPGTVWGKQKRYAIAGTVQGQPFQGTVSLKAKRFFVHIDKGALARAGLGIGEIGEFKIQLRA